MTTDQTPAVIARDVHKHYVRGEQHVNALRGVSVEIPAGAFCAITGPSGSGKSTLLNIVGLLDRPDSGRVFLHGDETHGLNAREAARVRRERVGFVFQDFNLVPVLSAFENVELPLRVSSGRTSSERREWVLSLLDAVGLSDRADHRPSQLSGGQQQRVAIARALVNRPAVVLADEPTANLDSHTGEEILNLMRRFNRDFATTFVFATHDTAIRDMADTVFHLMDGAVLA
ncbi:MAG: ABC transporter ATP-binding protein [Spirochaetota bacterium]